VNTPAKILIVDDSQINIKLLAQALKSDHRLSFATNGLKALEIVNSHDLPDLILLDLVLPDIHGFEICKRLKQNPRTKDIPIIFLTACSDDVNEEHGLQVGAVDYIIKPFNPAIVRARINTHIELKRSRDLLAALSSIDGLTGIANRRKFDEFLQSQWLKAIEQQHPISVLLADVDYFKAYNDHYGHLAGDVCLKRVAQATQYCLRKNDLVARYGGEEFAVIISECDVDGAKLVADRIHRHISEQQIEHADSKVHNYLTVSIGISACVPLVGSSPVDLLHTADRALYFAKDAGRNRSHAIPHPEAPNQ
jgi:diguanylate cyclase (GGDEF)-like protein